MSPRAAWRLESLGFTEVYDYVAGEADWFASGLPMEGASASRDRAGDRADPDVPTCGLRDSLQSVTSRVRELGWDACVVVNAQRIVLGLLRLDDVEVPTDTSVEQHMESGPSTFRPNAELDQPLDYMRRNDVTSVIISTSDGRLVGLLRRADADDARIGRQT
jgi:predicted transcriptional regulator